MILPNDSPTGRLILESLKRKGLYAAGQCAQEVPPPASYGDFARGQRSQPRPPGMPDFALGQRVQSTPFEPEDFSEGQRRPS